MGGNHGQLCERLVQLYHNAELRETMGDKGHERIMKQFSFAKMTEKYREELDQLHEDHLEAIAEAVPSQGKEPGLGAAAQKEQSLKQPQEEEEGESGTGREDSGDDDERKTELSVSNSVGSTAASTRSANVRRVLIDMDNTLVDWDSEFVKRWGETFGQDISEMIMNREHYEIEKNFPPEMEEKVIRVIASPGFYASLKPFRGAIKALQEMVEQGIDVLLVTAPHPSCAARCAAEKFQWVSEHLGDEWHSRLIIARDKTHVAGDVIIDDKPKISGSNSEPVWEHVIFDTSYNKDQVDCRKRLAEWSQWKKVLLC